MKWGQLKDWTYHANYPICYSTDSKVHSFLTFPYIKTKLTVLKSEANANHVVIRINLIQQELDEISKPFIVKK